MRIAFFTPLSPKRSGISDYSEALLPHLAERAGLIDVFVEDYPPAVHFAQENLRIRSWQEFEAKDCRASYDALLYQMGNNPFHVSIYELALEIPGVLVLHEFNLHHLLAAITIARGDWEGYLREVEYNGGSAALERAQWAHRGIPEPDYDGLAMNRRLLERSHGAIVHSEYMVRAVRDAGFRLPVRKIPHGVEVPSVDRSQAREQLASMAELPLDESTPLFGIFGFLKPYKRIHEALRAFARLRADYPQARIVLVGEEHPHYPLRPLIAELGIEDAARIVGYVSLDDFTTAIAACDVCLNLRWPTVGETSGSFLRALALGKPTLVSEVGTFLEYPEDVALKVPVHDREVDWLHECMKVLLDEPELARAVGERARAYVAQECAWSKVAAQYVEFLQQVATGEIPVRQDKNVPAATNPSAERVALPSFTKEEVEEYILGFSHETPTGEEYALAHRKRLAHTIEITPPGRAEDRILEMGCYMQMTPALCKLLGYGEVRGTYLGRAGMVKHRTATSIAGEVFSCEIDFFDAERDAFPYPDEYFRTVLCCELIEHLTLDPMHMMAEINRILAPGGFLVMSTPNLVSFRGVYALLTGYQPALFHAYVKPNENGEVDPRHSREYTPREIAVLMEAAGFKVELLETGDLGDPDWYYPWVQQLLRETQVSEELKGFAARANKARELQKTEFPLELRGDLIYCRARKIGPVRDRWPRELYYPP